MVDFKQLLSKAATSASQLPSFPQKGMEYHIDAQNPNFSTIEDVYEEERFGRKVWRKQTLYLVNTKEGLLRISPNQIQQLFAVLEKASVNPKTVWVTVLTSGGTDALKFELVSTDETHKD